MVLFVESFGTFLFIWPKVHAFWEENTVTLNSQGITFKPIDISDTVSGFLDSITCGSDCILLNYITLESRPLVYHTKTQEDFLRNPKHVSNPMFIASKNNKLLSIAIIIKASICVISFSLQLWQITNFNLGNYCYHTQPHPILILNSRAG